MLVSTAFASTVSLADMSATRCKLGGCLPLTVEPVSAAIAAYLVAEGPMFLRVVRRRRCRWFLKRNREEFESALLDETSGPMLELVNHMLPTNLVHMALLSALLMILIMLYTI